MSNRTVWGQREWFNAPVSFLHYDTVCLDQMHAIECCDRIREIIEDQNDPLSAVSAETADRKIEGIVSQPRSGLGHIFHRPTVYWRRAVPRTDAYKYDSIADLGDDDDLGNNVYDYIILYRSLTADERIKFRKVSGTVIISVKHNRDLVPYMSQWYSGPM